MQLLFLGDFLSSVFMGIIMTLDTFIYSLVNSSYRIFMAIASARLLSSDVYYEIANKIYIVVGVLMLFVLSYSILKAIVNPDELSKENNGAGIVKRIALAVIGLAITPVLFNVLYQAQGLFLEQDVLGKIFFRIDNTENVSISGAVNASGNPDEQIKTIGGAVAATSIWQAFFHPAEGANAADIKADPSDYYAKAAGTAALCGLGIAIGVIGVVAGIFTFGVGSALAAGAAVGLCAMSIQGDIEAGNELTAKYNGEEISLEEAYAIVAAGGDFDIFLIFMDNYLEDGEIEYFWGISTICGAFALYAFVSFSIDMGVRAAKLAYFQIIAPVPLVMQVLPKFKDTLGKYITQVVSTFVEVFIRISIVYIVTFVICHLTDLFSSFGNLWGSTSLNTPEKLIALALLIIGLIIFAKNAPEIITTSLSLPKGNMSLGIGKKMRDAAETSKVYAAGAIGGAGATSAVRNWNKAKENGKGFWGRAGSAISGMGSGMARAAFNQFGPGPQRKEAKDWDSMKHAAARAANEVADKKERTDKLLKGYNDLKSQYDADLEAYNKAHNEYKTADPARKAELDKQMAELQKRMAETRGKMLESTLFVDQLQNMGKSISSWSTGSINLAEEEAAIKFGEKLDSLKGDLRAEAYKKDDTARRLNSQYQVEKSASVSQYADGWDDTSYAQELSRRAEAKRRSDAMSKVVAERDAMDLASSTLESARKEIVRLTAAIDAEVNEDKKLELERQLSAAQRQLNVAQVSFDGAKSKFDSAYTLALDSTDLDYGSIDMSDIKLSDEAYREKVKAHDRKVESLRIAMEAAADEFVSRKVTENDSNTHRDVLKFVMENAAYISEHGGDKIVLDADGKSSSTVAQVITEAFGADALKGKVGDTSGAWARSVKQNDVFEIETSQKDAKGNNVVITYKREGSKYVPYDGTGKKVSSTEFGEVEGSKFFDAIQSWVEKGQAKKASSKTSVSKAADIGKASATYVRNNDYATKIARKRQSEEGKK